MLLFAAMAIGVVALAHTAPFPFLLDAGWSSRSMWRMAAAAGPPVMYFTFDDGPNPSTTPDLLDVLAREQVRATFFLIDRHITDETAPIVRRMFDEGHAVALHSHTRALMVMPPEDLARLLDAAANRIEALTGHRPCRAFRPHAGWRSGTMYAALAKLDYTLIGWGWNRWDWNWFRRRTVESIVRRIVARASPGDIVVIHDGDESRPRADQRQAVDAMARLIPELRSRGFDFGVVCGPGAPQLQHPGAG